MTRESLGTVRVHRWTCDECGKVEEHRSKASGTIPRPPGWSAISVSLNEGRPVEGHVCSPACAGEFVLRTTRDQGADDDEAGER